MTRDDVSSVAKNDPLIVALGESWYSWSIGNPKAKYYSSQQMSSSQQMRLMARLPLLSTSESPLRHVHVLHNRTAGHRDSGPFQSISYFIPNHSFQCIGHGGFGEVHLAKDKQHHELVALQCLNSPNGKSYSSWTLTLLLLPIAN